MKFILLVESVLTMLGLHVSAYGATGEEIYKAKCSTCHDSGAGQAPRVTTNADWSAREARGRNAMMESAIKGMPATAMAAKGGFTELSDADVRVVVDYMLARVGFRDNVSTAAPPVKSAPVAAAGNTSVAVDDATLVSRVADTLKKQLAPDARIELYAGEATLRGINIRVSVRDGVVTLSGAVEKSDLIPRAERITQAVAGVRRVDSKLVAAGMFDFD